MRAHSARSNVRKGPQPDLQISLKQPFVPIAQKLRVDAKHFQATSIRVAHAPPRTVRFLVVANQVLTFSLTEIWRGMSGGNLKWVN